VNAPARLDLTSRLEDFSGPTNNVRFADLDPKEHVNNAV
jgi:acyl-CoA thioester hydrolase